MPPVGPDQPSHKSSRRKAEKKVSLTVMITQNQRLRIKRQQEATGMSEGYIVREALDEYYSLGRPGQGIIS